MAITSSNCTINFNGICQRIRLGSRGNKEKVGVTGTPKKIKDALNEALKTRN